MEKMKMHTPNLADENFRKLSELFPNAVTESITGYDENGKAIVERAIDKDILMQEISANVVEGREERYQFTWPDKKKAMLAANAPIVATLRPVREESVGRDGTSGGWDSKNLYIEGDNLDVLKLLQETYLGKVKLIYIDPPYNTGHDFVYDDDYSEDIDSFLKRSGFYDDTGNRLEENIESNGRYHTDWLNMLYCRIKMAKNLMTEDGVIFISIDDHEVSNLRKICDEIFGASNFIDTIIWQKRYSPQNAVQYFSESHDYIVVYAKNRMIWRPKLLERTAEMNDRYRNIDNDPRGPWKAGDSTAQAGHGTKAQFYVLTAPNGKQHHLPSGACWRYTEDAMKELIADNRVWFGSDGNNVPAIKRFLSEAKQGVTCQTLWTYDEVGHSQEGKKEIKELFPEGTPFDTPKPTRLLKRIIDIASEPDSIIMDFFSGSASFAHSMFLSNLADQGSRRFILVQIKEKTSVDSEAYRIGLKDLCEVGKERIRRAGKKIKEEAGLTATGLDIGFRVLRLDSSNMQDVYYNPESLTRDLLGATVDNIRLDRSPEDLLFQVMLDLGVDLSSAIEDRIIDGKKVFIVKPEGVDREYLVACFDKGVTEETVTAIAKMQPYYAVFRDSGMDSDSVATNFDQIFRTYSPQTERKVL